MLGFIEYMEPGFIPAGTDCQAVDLIASIHQERVAIKKRRQKGKDKCLCRADNHIC